MKCREICHEATCAAQGGAATLTCSSMCLSVSPLICCHRSLHGAPCWPGHPIILLLQSAKIIHGRRAREWPARTSGRPSCASCGARCGTRSSTSQQVRACTHVSAAPRAGPRRAFSPTPAHAAATQLRQRKRSAPSRPNRSRPIRSRPNCTSQQVRARYRACACLRRAAASRTPAPASSPPSPACAPQEPASAAPASAAPRLRPPPTCAHSSRTRPRSLRSVPSSRLTSLS